jgi:hypothetical protein
MRRNLIDFPPWRKKSRLSSGSRVPAARSHSRAVTASAQPPGPPAVRAPVPRSRAHGACRASAAPVDCEPGLGASIDAAALVGGGRRQRSERIRSWSMRGRQDEGRRAPDRGAEGEGDNSPSPPAAPRFRRVPRLHQPLKLDLRDNFAESVADRPLNFGCVIRGSGRDERLAKRNFDQEARRLAFGDLGFESRTILDRYDVTSSMRRKRKIARPRACGDMARTTIGNPGDLHVSQLRYILGSG